MDVSRGLGEWPMLEKIPGFLDLGPDQLERSEAELGGLDVIKRRQW